VNCPEGEDWQNEKNGVARVLVKEGSSLYWCSGSLVNNTMQDGTPYFLTANHCGVNSNTADYNQWIFYFLYESPDCQFPGSEPTTFSMTGAKKIASASGETNSGSDFKLLLLNEKVPANYKPYFNGWNRTIEPASSGVDIHHPEGDLKMISTYLNPAVSTSYLGTNPDPNGHFWKIVWAPTDGGYGVTEGGSSGSPLFNSQGQVVGALTGGRASCSNQDAPDYFGKFSYSWDSNGSDSASQLSVWLAPGNPEVVSLNGSNLDTAGITADFRAEFTNILVGGTVSFVNNSSGNISDYEWYFPGGAPDFSEVEQPPTIQYNTAGTYDVKLEVSSLSGKDQLIRYQYIRVSPAIAQNPADGKYTLNFGKLVPDDLQIEVFDINGQTINFYVEERATSVVVNLSPFADGIYFIRTETSEIQQTYKVMLEKVIK
ncbi:MAG TPA: T9SS type A sorting domain-containing protein, partial [Bacteroidales bacterium]